MAVLCQRRWHHSQPAIGQWDGAWDTGTSQCHPTKLSPQVTPHLEEQWVSVPVGSAHPQTLPTAAFSRFSREEGEEMERGCCIPSFLDPPWDVLLHPWLFAAASKASREVMPNPMEQRRLEPVPVVLGPISLPGSGPRVSFSSSSVSLGCCWLCQGAEPLVWGLSRCHRFGICCKGLPLARDHCREHFLCNFLVLKLFLKLH